MGAGQSVDAGGAEGVRYLHSEQAGGAVLGVRQLRLFAADGKPICPARATSAGSPGSEAANEPSELGKCGSYISKSSEGARHVEVDLGAGFANLARVEAEVGLGPVVCVARNVAGEEVKRVEITPARAYWGWAPSAMDLADNARAHAEAEARKAFATGPGTRARILRFEGPVLALRGLRAFDEAGAPIALSGNRVVSSSELPDYAVKPETAPEHIFTEGDRSNFYSTGLGRGRHNHFIEVDLGEMARPAARLEVSAAGTAFMFTVKDAAGAELCSKMTADFDGFTMVSLP